VILVDTSIWIDHFRVANSDLVQISMSRMALIHPFIVGELAMGSLSNRQQTMKYLQEFPAASRATDAEVLDLIETRKLYGIGIGFADAHLLASCLLDGSSLWTRDRRLRTVAETLSIAADF
jgi:predicted nucleic acid-binding protein